MQKLIVFAGSTYYPSGGIDDLFCTADTVEEALEKLCNNSEDWDWWEIVDAETLTKVKEGANGLYHKQV